MKKAIIFTILLLIISLTIVIGREINDDKTSPFELSYLSQSTVSTPTKGTYTPTPTNSGLKSFSSSPTPIHTGTSNNAGLTVFKKAEKTIDVYYLMPDENYSFIRFEKKSHGTWSNHVFWEYQIKNW